jgi:UDP-N-acetylglucosamine 2-epimerase (non-hydrolysing)
MARSYLIITDSDCIAEEGLALRKPVLLLQEKTGQKGDLLPGGVKQIGLKRAGIVLETSRLIEEPNASKNLFAEFGLYGDGHAAERITQAIKYYFNRAERPTDYKPKTQVETANTQTSNTEMKANAMR